MNKLLLLLLPAVIFARSFMISNIPLPKTYIQNLDPYRCDEVCLEEYLDKNMIFSFLAHANKKLENKTLDEARVMNIAILNIGAFNAGGKLKIALILPYKKIGKYASSTVNATFAYLMTKSNPFSLKTYRVESENVADLNKAVSQISNDGFSYVIAPLTSKGVNNLLSLNPSINIYFPTVNKNDLNTSSNYIFGGIDYHAQSRLLLQEAVSPLVIFSDRSKTGKKLALYQEKEFVTSDTHNKLHRKVLKYFISRKTTNLERYLKENKYIENGSFFLNTPVIKSGMIMSQLTLYDTNATNILSTQINYNPLLLSMTQYTDRKKMIVANSIIKNNSITVETNSLLGNDIVYDWINYTTTVGIDYFYSQITGEKRDYNINIVDNQMIYDIELLHPGRSKFLPYKPPLSPLSIK